MVQGPQKIEDWPDDPSYDPKLHWAQINNDPVSNQVLYAKAHFDLSLKILKFMESGTLTAKEIYTHFEMTIYEFRNVMLTLHKCGVRFTKDRKDRVGTNRSTSYSVRSKPEKIFFRPPKFYQRARTSYLR